MTPIGGGGILDSGECTRGWRLSYKRRTEERRTRVSADTTCEEGGQLDGDLTSRTNRRMYKKGHSGRLMRPLGFLWGWLKGEGRQKII